MSVVLLIFYEKDNIIREIQNHNEEKLENTTLDLF